MNPIDTHENIADLFTKPLDHKKFWYFTRQAVGDYTADTHAHLIKDFSRQYKQRKPKDGGSVQICGQSAAPPLSSTLMKELARAQEMGRGVDRNWIEHTEAVVCTSAVDRSFADFSGEFYAPTGE